LVNVRMVLQVCKIFSEAVRLQKQPGTQDYIGRRDSQMLHGESFEVITFSDAVPGDLSTWAYGRSALDGYEGWMKDTDLVHAAIMPTHAVTSLMTNTYSAPDFKSTPGKVFSFMSRLTLEPDSAKNGFIKMVQPSKHWPDSWVPEKNLISLKDLPANPRSIIETATMFSGCPYGYSGRAAWGIDCSGLNQVVVQSKGIECMRDADQQVNSLGRKISFGKRRPGDFIFFNDAGKIHTGILISPHAVLNANARYMQVRLETLDEMIAHYGEGKGIKAAIKAVRRLDI
jgi:cell wall-associated NlpC family hydrolase